MTTQLALAMFLLQFVHNSPNMPVVVPPVLRYSLGPNLAECKLVPPYKLVALVGLTVDAAGNAQNVRIAKSSGNACADKQAIAAASHFRFSPALRETKPIPAPITLTMNMGRDR
jgi:TonB family protein